MDQVKQISRGSNSSFYYAFNLLNSEKRNAMNTIYAFCRRTDDIVDESNDSHEIKYENLVTDLKGTCKPLVEFLGLDWDESLYDYQNTAAKHNIKTPSYHQVIQPLYERSISRWKNYSEQMQPIFPLLAPWEEYFRYENL